MTDPQDRAKAAAKKPLRDRRQPRGAPGSVRWLKGLLGRPLALQRREGQLHVTLVDRRRKPEQLRADELAAVRQDLRARLLSQEPDHAARVMHHLGFVHDALGQHGWAGLDTLPVALLGKALVQAQMLAGPEGSKGMQLLIDKLRLAQVAADLREQRMARERTCAVEVSETTHADFEASERSWDATQAPGQR